MKVFTIIFSIYILALSIMPCSDAFNDCNRITTVRESTLAHNHQSDHNDFCSPFCTCSCCSISVYPNANFVSFSIAKPAVGSKVAYPIRDFSFVSNFYGNIWQPPKINA